MAKPLLGQSTDKKQDNQTLTLAQLLDTEQPYNKYSRFQDSEPSINNDEKLKKIQGSLVGLAVGDALGASVEFRPNAYLQQHPVEKMQGGGTWGLQAGQWTDDTSMALCLAASLIVKGESDTYDQFVRYKRWFRKGYMSSTGKCFDIGKSTREAIVEFERRQYEGAKKLKNGSHISESSLDKIIGENLSNIKFDINCAKEDSAGNGSLMRSAPIPLFFSHSPEEVDQKIIETTKLTHKDRRAIDACRFYAALICAAINGHHKHELIDPKFVRRFKPELHAEVVKIAITPYKNNRGYEDGIRGKGFVLNALEAALWAFHNDGDSFKTGVLLAVNLGDDTDTTAAIYGQLAGAVYGIENIPQDWRDQLFLADFIMTVAKGLYVQERKLDRGGLQRSDWSGNGNESHHQTNADNKSNHNQPGNTNDSSRQDHPTSPESTEPRQQQTKGNTSSHQDPQRNVADTPKSDKRDILITES